VNTFPSLNSLFEFCKLFKTDCTGIASILIIFTFFKLSQYLNDLPNTSFTLLINTVVSIGSMFISPLQCFLINLLSTLQSYISSLLSTLNPIIRIVKCSKYVNVMLYFILFHVLQTLFQQLVSSLQFHDIISMALMQINCIFTDFLHILKFSPNTFLRDPNHLSFLDCLVIRLQLTDTW